MAKTSLAAGVSIVETARILGIGRSSAYLAASTGEIPTLRIGRRLIVPRVALEKMLADAGKGNNDNA